MLYTKSYGAYDENNDYYYDSNNNEFDPSNKKLDVIHSKISNDFRGKQTLSLGLNGYPEKSPRRDDISKRLEKSEKFQAYQAQMQADEQRSIQESRRPYIRNIEPMDDQKFTIGKYLDADEIKKKKMTIQQQYREQLEADRYAQPLNSDRRSLNRRSQSPYDDAGGGFLNIGNREATDRTNQLDRKVATIKMQQQYDNNLGRNSNYQPPSSQRNNEPRSNEDGYSFQIGQTVEREKQRKAEMRIKYAEQLRADQGDRSNGYSERPPKNYSQYHDHIVEEEYVNNSGWTGLNVGGSAIGNTNSQAQLHLKSSKQAEYKRLLDEQLQLAKELQLLEESKYRGL
eukprot:gene4079-5825_t